MIQIIASLIESDIVSFLREEHDVNTVFNFIHNKNITYIAWRSDNDGPAQRWWREAILRAPFLNPLYA